MKLKTEPQVLECLLAVNLDVNIWSARRKLLADDFAHAQLPPEGLASLGSKKICDPKELRIFGTLKARAVSLLDKSGVRFLGGWAVPEANAPAIIAGLEEIGREFMQAKSDFMGRYDQAVQQWIKENTGWEKIIANSVVSAQYVARRIDFHFQMFKVVNPAKGATGLKNEVENLGGTLFDEVAKAAQETWKKTYAGRKEITRKALSPLKVIHAKLNDLRFIEPKVSPVAELIQSALDKIPKRGAINGHRLLMLQGLVSLLSDTQALLSYAKEIIDGRSQDSILDCLIQGPVKSKRNKASFKTASEDTSLSKPLPSLGLW